MAIHVGLGLMRDEWATPRDIEIFHSAWYRTIPLVGTYVTVRPDDAHAALQTERPGEQPWEDARYTPDIDGLNLVRWRCWDPNLDRRLLLAASGKDADHPVTGILLGVTQV